MSLTQAEFDAILVDRAKSILGDITWQQSEDHAPWLEFRAEVQSAAGWPLFVTGSYNPLIPALSYTLILKTVGRVYGLDLGKDHHNPQCNQVGETHKHRWTEKFGDKEAYAPSDITAQASQPIEVWRQFCAEAHLVHNGILNSPPPQNGELF